MRLNLKKNGSKNYLLLLSFSHKLITQVPQSFSKVIYCHFIPPHATVFFILIRIRFRDKHCSKWYNQIWLYPILSWQDILSKMESSKSEGLHLSWNKTNVSFNNNIKPNSHRSIPTINTKSSKLSRVVMIAVGLHSKIINDKIESPILSLSFSNIITSAKCWLYFPYLQIILK